MKKIILTIMVIAALMSMAACSAGPKGNINENQSSSNEIVSKNTGSKAEFTDENGILTYLDTENSPFEDSGLKITADKSAKTVKFVKTDLEGNETLEYYLFDYNSNTVEQYYYVSMMGTGFYYTYDLEADEIVKVEDSDHNDSTQSAKDSGRYDGANERMKSDVAAIEEYFSEQFGMTISEMANSAE